MKIRFPDGSHKPTTEIRATYRLEAIAPKIWNNDRWVVYPLSRPDRPMMYVKQRTEDGPILAACLDHMGEGQGYGGGAWPDGVATAFTVKRDGDALVLELWDVEATEPGPNAIPYMDGKP